MGCPKLYVKQQLTLAQLKGNFGRVTLTQPLLCTATSIRNLPLEQRDGECLLWVVKGPPRQHDIVASRDTAPYEAACVPVINPWTDRRRFWSGALHDNGLTALCVPLSLKPQFLCCAIAKKVFLHPTWGITLAPDGLLLANARAIGLQPLLMYALAMLLPV